jgi:molybdopterin-binding protein
MAKELALTLGDMAVALIKATEVMIALLEPVPHS